jgi:hypothetical protein
LAGVYRESETYYSNNCDAVHVKSSLVGMGVGSIICGSCGKDIIPHSIFNAYFQFDIKDMLAVSI